MKIELNPISASVTTFTGSDLYPVIDPSDLFHRELPNSKGTITANNSKGKIQPFQIVNPSNDINNQILLAISEDSFTREVTNNAITAPSLATLVIWGATDPALVGLTGYNKRKLSCYNNGRGMNKDTLDKVTNFSASDGKSAGIHGNKGKGEKLSGMAINSTGMVWISCTEDPLTGLRKVYRVVMIGDPVAGDWGKEKFLVDDEHGSRYETVVDITDIIDLKALDLDIDKDWTLKIYCGVERTQNTVENLYGETENDDGTGIRRVGTSRHGQGWLVRELSRKFPILPKGVTIKIDDSYLTNDNKDVFLPVLDAIKKYAGNDTEVQFETVRVHLDKEIQTDSEKYSVIKKESLGTDIPFFTENKTVNVTFVYDPHCGMKGNELKSTIWYKTRMGVTGVFSGIIWKNELYDFKGPKPAGQKGAPDWKGTAFDLGIINGYDQFRIFVTLPEADHIVNDENRTKIIDRLSSKKEEFKLRNFRKVVQAGMPQWFVDLMEKYAPKVPDDKELQEKYQKILEEQKQYTPGSYNPAGNQPPLSNPGQSKHQKAQKCECPDCAKNGMITIIPKGVRKCPICGYVKPPSTGINPSDKNKNRIEDHNGTLRIIKKWPDTITFHDKTEWAGLGLCDNFEQMAAQYLYNDGKLYINGTYPGFFKLTDLLLRHIEIDGTHSNFEEIKKHVESAAELFIKDNCLCAGLLSAISKTNEPGFKGDDEAWQRSVTPSVLSVYADHWMASAYSETEFTRPLFKRIKTWFSNFNRQTDDASTNEYDQSELDNRILNAGGKVPKNELF